MIETHVSFSPARRAFLPSWPVCRCLRKELRIVSMCGSREHSQRLQSYPFGESIGTNRLWDEEHDDRSRIDRYAAVRSPDFDRSRSRSSAPYFAHVLIPYAPSSHANPSLSIVVSLYSRPERLSRSGTVQCGSMQTRHSRGALGSRSKPGRRVRQPLRIVERHGAITRQATVYFPLRSHSGTVSGRIHRAPTLSLANSGYGHTRLGSHTRQDYSGFEARVGSISPSSGYLAIYRISPSETRPTERSRSYVPAVREARVNVQRSAFRWHYRGEAEY